MPGLERSLARDDLDICISLQLDAQIGLRGASEKQMMTKR